MKVVLSPAKSLDFETPLPIQTYTCPLFESQTKVIVSELKKMSKKEIASLMKLSDKLAELNYLRYQEFSFPFTPQNARPAVFAFSGDVYVGLDVYTLSKEKIEKLQETVLILSGLYGLLRPLDLIQPYRLEMGTKFTVNQKKDLYDFWKEKVTKTLNEMLTPNELFVNLASVEYFKAIDVKQLKTPVITPIFKDFKNGELKVISFFAKKARGLMARYCVENNIQTLESLKLFNKEGYSYSQEHTKKENQPVFIR